MTSETTPAPEVAQDIAWSITQIKAQCSRVMAGDSKRGGEAKALALFVFDELSDLETALSSTASQLAAAQQENERRKHQVEILLRERKDEVWIWQNDEEDHPESLTCPVLMSVEHVRAFVADRQRAEQAEARATAALKLAKEATNGWACYAKRAVEHMEITRLHRQIDAALSPTPATEPQP